MVYKFKYRKFKMDILHILSILGKSEYFIDFRTFVKRK